MRHSILGIVACGLTAAGAAAGDGSWLEQFVQRTPPRKPIAPGPAQAGSSHTVAWWAVPGVGKHTAGGYVGGATPVHNHALAKNTLATGPIYDGTFGWDFVGFHYRAGRVFLRPSNDPSHGRPFYAGYRAEGPRVPDVFALRPFRKAVLEAKDEKHHEGGEGE